VECEAYSSGVPFALKYLPNLNLSAKNVNLFLREPLVVQKRFMAGVDPRLITTICFVDDPKAMLTEAGRVMNSQLLYHSS